MNPHQFHLARVGAGVTDLAPARAFYAALGFDVSDPFDLGTAIAEQSLTPGSPLVISIVRRDGFDLELVQHGGARPAGRPPARRALDQLGLAYLALSVDDVDRVSALVEGHGGWVLGSTRCDRLGGDAVSCLDPSGVRVLLLGPGAMPFARPEPTADGIAVAHIGVSVADLPTSTAFYAALGFELGERVELGASFGLLAEVEGVDASAQPLHEGAFPFLLLQWGPSRDPGRPPWSPLNRVGDLIHVGSHCDAFEPMVEVAVAAGARVVEATRAAFPAPALEMPWEGEPHGWVFVTDPNGVQIEIVGPRVG